MIMNSFELLMRIGGFPLDAAQNELKRIQALPDLSFLDWQLQRRWEIFNYHYQNNTQYRSFIGNANPKVWDDIPVLKKESIQKPITSRLSNGFQRSSVFINHTSGSTGTPFYFAKDKFAHAMTWALIADRYSWHGIDIFKDRQARFYGIPFAQIPRMKEKVKDFLMNRVRFNVLDPTDHTQKSTLRRLISGNFDYINGYSRSLTIFSKYLLKSGIVLKNEISSIRKCFVTSGMLTDEDRQIISDALGICIINEYGASELSIIAFEDKEFDWLISDEELYVEVVDEKGQLLPAGSQGRLLVTSLFNKAMPFIRYDIGDIAVLGDNKKGKYSILKSLVGRSNDYMVLKNGNLVTVAILEHVIKPILANNFELKEYLIRQWDFDIFSFEYVSDIDIEKTKEIQVKKDLEKYLGHPVIFNFLNCSKIERTSSWKLKYFERMF